MKILIIGNGYPTKQRPQWGHFERDQALALRNLGHDVAFLYVDSRIRFGPEKLWRRPLKVERREEKGIQIFGVTMFPLSLLKLVNKRAYELAIPRVMYKGLESIIKSIGKPDVMYAHFMFNIAYAAYLKERSCIPLVGMEHWSVLTQDKLTKDIRRLGNKAYSSADKLLAVSKSLQTHIFRHFNKESTVVYDMLGQEFVTTEVNQRLKKTPFKFITVGNLVAIKGYQMLIKAFSKSGLVERGCTLSIVGDGVEHDTLLNQINEAGLGNNIFLLGRKTKEDIISLLSESHVFVVSSKSETFGVACIEALSQGLPVIATKCGGPEEFIDSKNGILVERGNASEMAEAMRRIHDEYSHYDSFEIARGCRQRFNPQSIANRLSEILTLGGGKFFFVAIGNLIHRKGFDVLLSSFQKSNLADRGCRIIIVGDGPEKMKLDEQAKFLGISDFVQLTGRLTKQEIIGIMSICNAFIMSSRAETFGVVCIEALSQGLPNIATICGGPEEFITRKNGFLIKPDNVECLADAMVSMFENYKMFNQREIARDCLNQFSPHVIAKQLMTIFKNTINNN